MADDKNINNPEEPANDNNEQQQPGNDAKKGKPAADYAAYRKASKEFRQARQKQENLEKYIKKYKQEAQEKQDKHEPLTMGDIEALKLDYDIETGALLVNGETPPQLDPDSPQFDPALYNEYAAAVNEKLNETMAQVGEVVRGYASDIMNTEEMQAMLKTISETVAPALDSFKNIVASIFDSEALRGVKESLRYITEHSEELKQSLQEWEALQPYLEEELKKPEYEGRTLHDLLENEYKDENGEILAESLLEKAIAAAKAAMLEKQLPIVTITNRVTSVDYPLDKVNANIWRLLQEADKTGQLTFAVEKRGSKKPADILYSIDFAALEEETGVTITKKLTAFDKRVYIAAGALFNNGLEVVTVSQIYFAMGNSGRPSAADCKKINESLTKMQAAHIYLNNISEHKLYSKYDKFVYDASLLPMERITAVVNGQEVESAIHLFREPPLITFARERKQITTISRKLLESPLSKTDANLLIDDYLLERISHIKNSKGKKTSNKLLYATIYEKCHITTGKQRSRAKEKIIKYLEHYKECEFIKAYKEEADGITIIY